MVKTAHYARHEILDALMALVSPAGDRNMVLPPESDWDELEYLSRYWHVAPSLWKALRNNPNIAVLSEVRKVRMRKAYVDNLRRNTLLRQDILRISARLNDAGFVPVLLKGAAALFDPRTDDIAERYMHDLDIMVDIGQEADCYRFLVSIGCIPPDNSNTDKEIRLHQWPTLYDPVSELEIETSSASPKV